MPQENSQINVVLSMGKVAVIGLGGRLTAVEDKVLTEAYEQASKKGATFYVLDFGNVTHMNTPGASALVKLQVRAKASGQKLLAYALAPQHKDSFKLTQLDEVVKISDSSGDMVGALKDWGQELSAADQESLRESLSPGPSQKASEDAAHWARPVSKLTVPKMPKEAVSLNVGGRKAVGPIHGFGPMWEKTYQVHFTTSKVPPVDVIKTLKANFPEFQPPENRFYPTQAGVQPGEIVLINSSTPGGPAYTGVVVSYADDECFTLMTPKGHPESGWVTFSSFVEDGHTVAQVQGLARAHDPVFELAFRLKGSKFQEKIWKHVLTSLGDRLGEHQPVQMRKFKADSKMQWSESKNLWYNAQFRSLAYAALRPLRWVRDRFKK